MRNFIMAALLILFSINGVASAAADDIFEIEAEGSYRMEADSSVDLAKKVALFVDWGRTTVNAWELSINAKKSRVSWA